MILIVLAYFHVFYSFWVVFSIYIGHKVYIQELILVCMFWNFTQAKLCCQAECEQSEKHSNREFHLKLGRVNFPLKKN